MLILVGVDDSKHSQAALEFVKKMSWPKGTQVTVVSSIPEFLPAYTEVYVPAAPYSEQMMQDMTVHHQELVAEAERSLREAGVHTVGKVMNGDPRTVLVDLARNNAFDLIVVGSHGRTGIAKLLLGSVASYVVSHAHCNVMVVKVA